MDPRLLFGAAIVVTFVANQFVMAKGNASNGKIWDAGFAVLPYVPYDHIVGGVIANLPLLMHPSFIPQLLQGPFMTKFAFALLLRAVTMSSTVLPKTDPTCDSKTFTVLDALGGHCYDQMFSGHMAFSVLMTSAMVSAGVITGIEAVLYSAATALYLLITRSHYTMDVLVGAIIATLL